MCGGLVTILVLISVGIQSVFVFKDEIINPDYKRKPTTFDFNYDKEVAVNLRTNMMAYTFGQSYDADEIFTYVRVVFQTQDQDLIPAVYCSDFFADEIAAEANG